MLLCYEAGASFVSDLVSHVFMLAGLQIVWNSNADRDVRARSSVQILSHMASSSLPAFPAVSNQPYKDVSSLSHTEMLWVRRGMRSVLFAMQGFRFPGLQLQAFLPVLPQDAPVTSTSDAD